MPNWSARWRDIRSVADAPSESCEELPGVTEPAPLVLSKYGFSADRPSKRCISAIAFVAIAEMLLLANCFTRLLVENGASDLHGRDLAFEESFRLRSGGSSLALK